MEAVRTMMIPPHRATRRAATPVRSAMEMLAEYVVLGTVPARLESRLPTPSAFSPRWTTLKSTGTAVRWETRCIAMAWP